MKKLSLLSVAVFICGVFSINAQNTDTNKRRCYFTEHMELLKTLYPTLDSIMQADKKDAQEWIKNNQDYFENSKAVVTIPVVVHIVGANASSSVTDARVQEQIAVLNRDYAGLNPHSMGAFASTLKVNTGIQFCLAKRDLKGVSTTGIERRTTGGVSFGYDNKMKSYATGGLDQWDPKKYMNIWVCSLTGGIMGFGEPPVLVNNALPSSYGVVINYSDFCGGCGTLTHEIGHCFYLFHIWGEASLCSTDYCDDTPPQKSPTSGAPTGVKTDACSPTSPGIMYMNFMDYTDDIKMANFTPDQREGIQLRFTPGRSLNSLSTSNGCVPVGIEENDYIQNVNIYPNPTNGELNIEFNIANPCDVNVSIQNILGEEIYSFNKNKTSVVNANVDISNQAAGIYFVKIKTEKQILTQKISLLK